MLSFQRVYIRRPRCRSSLPLGNKFRRRPQILSTNNYSDPTILLFAHLGCWMINPRLEESRKCVKSFQRLRSQLILVDWINGH